MQEASWALAPRPQTPSLLRLREESSGARAGKPAAEWLPSAFIECVQRVGALWARARRG